MHCGELIEERENRDAIHHRGFEKEALVFARGKVAERAISVYDRSLFGCDGVRTIFECGAYVINGRLASLDIQ